ncbi:SIR2 family NAD-dependent protein deacylase [Paramaledivibacter caminithermalis]|jgi:NAD-dependent deacetylase|uniref:protein acetyllysine N-acetyltransferase n=1 Tax=Paramaledivibacter caminithermalis (strain DSM 15212 / CIP 107654 / DViRD3) TaxID=1121301 RepID=A0A1M6RM76_PARC5|nr:Sir2 family NAD-dependent protein deacetylase [Paramaledivibacter caminithermalis]SHK33510.1 NAD-dependent deacetylase [Paramaledivibacter caminithermalis DSM 15212]
MKKLVAFTGAGVSRDSGIPTFVELGDLREKLSRSYFNSYPMEFYNILKEFRKKIKEAKPNDAHRALAKYDVPIITMNIDSLHERAGSKKVLEIHGNLTYVFCPKCNKEYNFDTVYDSIYCSDCNEILQPNVVLYGDMIPGYMEAMDIIDSADVLLVIGTSFYTSTAGFIVERAKSQGVKVDIINENAMELVPKYLENLLGIQ